MPAERLALLIGGWLLTYLIHSTALLGGVAIASRWLRGRERLTEWLWRTALFGALFTTAVQVSGVNPGMAVIAGAMPTLVKSIVPDPAALLLSSNGHSVIVAGVVIWLVTACGGVLQLGLARARLGQLLKTRYDVGSALRSCGAMHIPHHIRITASPAIGSPMVVDVNELCFPAWSLGEFSRDELASVMAHELAHVSRRDGRWLSVIAFVGRVLWVQPLNRVAAARLRALAEHLCDEHAVKETGARVALASALSKVAARLPQYPRVAVVGMASRESPALLRIRHILDESIQPSRKESWFTLRGLAMGPIAALAVAGPGITFPETTLSSARYTISAFDDAGPFAVTLENGIVQSVSLEGVPVPPGEIEQNSNHVFVTRPGGASFEITLLWSGGMTWESRPLEWGADAGAKY
ncbi:MAG: M56 family metallopeptidase [Gemmatimonadota bacterium]